MMDAGITKTTFLTASDIDAAFDAAGAHVDAKVRVAIALEAALLIRLRKAGRLLEFSMVTEHPPCATFAGGRK